MTGVEHQSFGDLRVQAGPRSLTAEYGGDANFQPSVSAPATLVVGALLLGYSLTRPAGASSFTLTTSLLAIVWALFSGEVSLRELVVGFLIGFLILRLFPRALGTGAYVSRSLALLRFLAFFVRELTTANVQVALFALRPRPPLNPMIVAVPLHLHGDTAHTILAAVLGGIDRPSGVASYRGNRRCRFTNHIDVADRDL